MRKGGGAAEAGRGGGEDEDGGTQEGAHSGAESKPCAGFLEERGENHFCRWRSRIEGERINCSMVRLENEAATGGWL